MTTMDGGRENLACCVNGVLSWLGFTQAVSLTRPFVFCRSEIFGRAGASVTSPSITVGSKKLASFETQNIYFERVPKIIKTVSALMFVRAMVLE
jgi:hypothetical protein